MRSLPRLDLAAAAALAVAAVAVAFAPEVETPLRVLLELPLALALPGYALTRLAAPRLGAVDRLTFTLGTSVALAVLAGLALDFTSWGLQRRSWAVALAGITVVSAAIAALARKEPTSSPDRARVSFDPLSTMLLCAAVLLAAAAVGVARSSAVQSRHAASFTQLWMLPTSAKTWNVLRLGVANRGGTSETYRVVIRAGSTVLATWPRVIVLPSGRWQTTVTVSPWLPPRTQIETDLYRAGAPRTIYRRVTAWVGAGT